MGLFGSLTGKSTSKAPVPSSVNEDMIRSALSKVRDPDLHRDIISLGFVNNVSIDGGKVAFTVELTTPACPVKELLRKQCEEAVEALPGVTSVQVTMTAQTRGSSVSAPNVADTLGAIKNIIAVASGKGGVGKSTTAVNLAYALASTGSKVGILDADIYGPSVPLMTKVSNPEQMQGSHVVPPVVNGIKMISVAMFGSANNAAILRGPMAAQIIKQFLTQVAWGELDYLVIDYPPGTGDIQLTLSQMAPITAAVIVTTPQEVALIDVRKAVSMFNTLKVPVLGVVETMSYFVCDGCSKKHFIFRQSGGQRVADEHGLPLLGQIPIDPGVAEGADTGKPVVTQAGNPASDAYNQMAGEVARHLSILHANNDDRLEHFSFEWQS